jgi:vancomycin resistance protein YoaR
LYNISGGVHVSENQNLPIRGQKREFEVIEKRNKTITRSLIIVSVIILNLVVIFAAIACINKLNTNVYKNVYFNQKNLSGYTSKEVVDFLKDQTLELAKETKVSIYQGDEKIYSVLPEDLKFEIDIEKTAKSIIDFGRSGNIIKDNIDILNALITGKSNIPIAYKYDDESLNGLLKNIDLSVKDRYVDDTYSVDEKNKSLVIVVGKTGNSIDYDTTKQDIIKLLSKSSEAQYNLKTVKKTPKKLDSLAIHESVAREVKDAYIDKTVTPNKYVSEIYGLDFDVSELTNFLKQPDNMVEGKSIEFALKVTDPKVKLVDITYTLYKDKIAGFTTYFDPTQKARASNLQIALKYLNNVIVMPGETFSYNKIVGETTSQKGYLPAATFKAGTVVQEIGGGICQTSSTLYYVSLLSNLEIVERHQHGLPVGYIKPSLDATVYGDVLDFKFKNNRTYPIKIVTSFSASGSLNVSIYGTKESQEYEVILGSKVLYYIPYDTQYIYDNNMNENTQIVVTDGVRGYASEGYITKKLNGKTVSSALLSKDVYKPKNKVVRVGTKKTQSTVTTPTDPGNVSIY